jgi:hypothetical protein
VSHIDSTIDSALAVAIHNRLHSMVYSALDLARSNSADPKASRPYWREVSSYCLSHLLVASARKEICDYGETFHVDP